MRQGQLGVGESSFRAITRQLRKGWQHENFLGPLISAADISDRGEITGDAVLPNGDARAFLKAATRQRIPPIPCATDSGEAITFPANQQRRAIRLGSSSSIDKNGSKAKGQDRDPAPRLN